MPAELRSAATVLLLRDGVPGVEVFMVRRHSGAAFMGGAHVFPGGAVDPADRELGPSGCCDGIEHAAAAIPSLERAEAIALHVGAARELFEEAGVLLARQASGEFAKLADPSAQARFSAYRLDIQAGRETLRQLLSRERLRLALDALALCAHWVTPPLDTRRFDTRFFLARLPIHQHPAHDQHETTESRWVTPAGAIGAAGRLEIILPSPTWAMLREIESFRSVDEALEWASTRDVPRREPKVIDEGGTRMLILPGDPLHPAAEADPPRFETRFVWRGDRFMPQAY